MAQSWWVRTPEKRTLLTAEQVETLSRFEGQDRPFTTALDAGYTRAIPQADLEVMSRVYHEAKGTTYKLHTGCSRCVFNFVRELAQMYRNSVEWYEEQALADAAEAEAQRKAERNAKDRARRAARKAAKAEEGK